MALQITTLPPAPQRTDTPDDFSDKADAFVDSQAVFVDETNALATEAETNANTAETSATTAVSAAADATVQATIAQTAAYYQGLWSAQTGAANIPYNVYHLGLFWALNEDIADVTASEPGISSDFTPTTPAGQILESLFNGGPAPEGWAGYSVATEFDTPTDGDITETLYYPVATVFATRVTTKDVDGNLTTTTLSTGYNISSQSVITFNDPTDGITTTTVTEV